MPTNQMDVINALVVSGTFHLKHYDELTAHDQKDTPVEDEYSWKKTFAMRYVCQQQNSQIP
jgi:hypothetical protein